MVALRMLVVGTSVMAVVAEVAAVAAAEDGDTPVAVAQQVNAVPCPPVHPAHIASHNTPVARGDLAVPPGAEVAVVLRFPLFLLYSLVCLIGFINFIVLFYTSFEDISCSSASQAYHT